MSKADMKAFILSKVYCVDIALTCAQARASEWQKLKKKSTVRLPPDDDTLNHHCARTKHITYCQFHFTLVEHPTPISHGSEIINGKCQPVRYTLPPLPHQVMAHEYLLNSGDESGELLWWWQWVKRVNRFRWVTCTISNLKITIMPDHETDSKSQLSDPKYPQNHKNRQSCGTKVCKGHLHYDDHLAFEGLNRV